MSNNQDKIIAAIDMLPEEMEKDTALVRAFLEGKKSERKAIAKWLREKSYFTLADLVKAGVHIVEKKED